jgi:hypothetical protein
VSGESCMSLISFQGGRRAAGSAAGYSRFLTATAADHTPGL